MAPALRMTRSIKEKLPIFLAFSFLSSSFVFLCCGQPRSNHSSTIFYFSVAHSCVERQLGWNLTNNLNLVPMTILGLMARPKGGHVHFTESDSGWPSGRPAAEVMVVDSLLAI